MTKEVLKLALEALKGVLDDTPKVLDASIAGGLYEVVQCRDAICAIKEALAQPEQEQEPLTENGMYRLGYHNGYGFGEAYGKANAPQREFVGLTDEEIKAFDTWHDNREEEVGWCNPSEIVAYIEAKLKEKNT